MRTLWSRAACNPGTYRCISCVSTATAAVKRPVAATLRTPSLFGTPTSTFVYTAIFAAGIALDGKAKHTRNEQWEKAFAIIREEVANHHTRDRLIQEESDQRIADAKALAGQEQVLAEDESFTFAPQCLLPREVFPNGVDWDLIHQIAGMDLSEQKELDKRESDVDFDYAQEDLWDLLPYDSRFPEGQILEWPPNTGFPLIRHHLPPQSLWSYDNVRLKALKTRQSWKKLAIQELSIGILIRALLSKSQYHISLRRALTTIAPDILDIVKRSVEENWRTHQDMLQRLRTLENTSKEISNDEIMRLRAESRYSATPQYSQDKDGDYHYIAEAMNAAINKVFREGDKLLDESFTAFAVVRICHNLLVSSAAPDVQTFNLLISGFKRWNLPEMVDEVILAFDSCKIRPNEITCAAILDHYVQGNCPDDFSHFVARMRGLNGALMLARADININEAGGGRLIRVNEDKVYQKVYPTPMVFNTLVLGVLKFAGFERALDIYYDMKGDGWGLDVLGLTHLLVDCVRRSDWHGGLFIWQEINRIKNKSKREHMAKAYSNFLALCSVTGNTAAFNQILTEVARRRLERREILSAAMSMMETMRSQPGSESPAFTADNVLIAVSSYIQEASVGRDTTELNAPQSTDALSGNMDQTIVAPQTSKPLASRRSDPFPEIDDALSGRLDRGKVAPKSSRTLESKRSGPFDGSPEKAWDSWLEHELGEKRRIDRDSHDES